MKRTLAITLLLTVFFSASANRLLIKLADKVYYKVISRDVMLKSLEKLYSKKIQQNVLLFSESRAMVFGSIKIVPKELLEKVGTGKLSISRICNKEVAIKETDKIFDINHWNYSMFQIQANEQVFDVFKFTHHTGKNLHDAIPQNLNVDSKAFSNLLEKHQAGESKFLSDFFVESPEAAGSAALNGTKIKEDVLPNDLLLNKPSQEKYELSKCGKIVGGAIIGTILTGGASVVAWAMANYFTSLPPA